MAALIGVIHAGRDVDTQPEIALLHGLQKLLRLDTIIKHRGNRGDVIQPVNHGIEVRFQVAIPMCQRHQVLARAQCAPMPGIPKIHGPELQRQPQKLALLLKGAFFILSATRNREDDKVIVETSRIAKPV
jgi:hypothetical protein